MNKDKVIKMRTALKAGGNLPLLIFIDNDFKVIDEGATGHFTFWDDQNGILYSLEYVSILKDRMPTNTKNVSMFAVDYDCIQCMQLASIPLDSPDSEKKDLDDLFATLKASGKDVSDERIALIKNFYNKVLDPNEIGVNNTYLNGLLGSDLNEKDDYYNGRFTENFKETTRHRERNKEINDSKNRPTP